MNIPLRSGKASLPGEFIRNPPSTRSEFSTDGVAGRNTVALAARAIREHMPAGEHSDIGAMAADDSTHARGGRARNRSDAA